jgi:hypothetical protein
MSPDLTEAVGAQILNRPPYLAGRNVAVISMIHVRNNGNGHLVGTDRLWERWLD